MRTRTEDGQLYAPICLLEMPEFRFGAFETIAYAAVELGRKNTDSNPPNGREDRRRHPGVRGRSSVGV
jgi:hypothetical protein